MSIIKRQKTACKIYSTLFSVFFLLVFTNCGLDVYPFFDPPYTDGHIAYYTSDDAIQNYFSFITNETSDNNTENDFLGTEIYYKIYNNYSIMVSAENSVSSLNSSTTNSTAAIENLIDSRGYKPLKLSTGSLNPLIQDAGQNRYVYIRLNDYPTDSTRSAAIRIGSSSMSDSTSGSPLTYKGTSVFPRRYIDSDYGFNFNSSSSSNPLPKSGDADVNFSSSSSDSGVWYVDMYAVSVGRDSSFTSYYSKVLFLGSISIKEADYNN